MMYVLQVMRWLHLLCMVGTFGVLFLFQFGLPPAVRRDEANGRAVARVANILIGLGFVVGLLMYGIEKGHLRGGHFNGVIAMKFLILLAVGALLAMSKKQERGDKFRSIALALLALAAFLGTTIS